MKKHYFLLIISLIFASAQAQFITFSNTAFKTKLLESSSSNFIARDLNGDYFAIDANSNNEIEFEEALEVAFLEIGGYAIGSLSGIENFTNLVSLQCENNQITTLNVTNLIYLNYLDCSNNQINFLNVNGLTELNYLNCQTNSLQNLNASGITNLITLDCSYNTIVNLNLNNLINLETLNCSYNQIQAIDLTDLISLNTINCGNNLLTSIDTSSLVNLISLICNSNSISSLTLNGLNNFTNLDCSNNQLSSLNLANLINLETINSNFNQLPLINLNGLVNLKNLSCTYNLLSFLNLNELSQLENVNCQNNQITTIQTDGLSELITLNCNINQLTSLDLSSLINIRYLYCDSNQISSLQLTGLNLLQVVSCNNNSISILNVDNLTNLQSLYCSNNQIVNLNLNNLPNLQSLFCSNNTLNQLFIKNGSNETNLQFSGNANLNYICADELDVEYVQSEIDANSYNCTVNEYCSFVPGGNYYTIQGNTKFDSTTNGCDVSDSNFPAIKFSISNGTTSENHFANATGNYSKSVNTGSYTLTPILENPNYFLVAPSSVLATFPQNANPFNQNFCITPNGNHSDLEITILPITTAVPGGNASYKIVYKNKGTVAQSGSINLSFNGTNLTFTSANPSTSTQNTSNLNWLFTNLMSLETRTIFVQLNVSSTTVSVGQLMAFSASVISSSTDETPNNNISYLNQTVVTTTTTNDKLCLEGNSISIAQVGDYVHYIIRFKNTGNTVAQNIVVSDVLDTTKFDTSTIIPIDASHLFTARLTNSNKVEFIFENINLPFNNGNNECFIAFKIKTLPTLNSGDVFSNTASIYFDYKMPIGTNTESTAIETLSNFEIGLSNNFVIYPNPVKNNLFINAKNNAIIETISIYNSVGQLIQINSNPNSSFIDVSNLKAGVYFIMLLSENRNVSLKFLKE